MTSTLQCRVQQTQADCNIGALEFVDSRVVVPANILEAAFTYVFTLTATKVVEDVTSSVTALALVYVEEVA